MINCYLQLKERKKIESSGPAVRSRDFPFSQCRDKSIMEENRKHRSNIVPPSELASKALGSEQKHKNTSYRSKSMHIT